MLGTHHLLWMMTDELLMMEVEVVPIPYSDLFQLAGTGTELKMTLNFFLAERVLTFVPRLFFFLFCLSVHT
jgi:hypothetical protein